MPIVIGTDAMPKLYKIEKALIPYFTPNNRFVISSDFSHYPTYEEANLIDNRSGKAIEYGSLSAFVDALHQNETQFPNLATSACAHSAIKVLLMLVAGKKDIDIHHLLYRNSGDTPYGNKGRVVGYHSFSFTARPQKQEFLLTKDEKSTLLKIALKSIDNVLNKPDVPTHPSHAITPTRTIPCAAFGPLQKPGKLGGCMSRFGGNQPQYEVL